MLEEENKLPFKKLTENLNLFKGSYFIFLHKFFKGLKSSKLVKGAQIKIILKYSEL
jgi:hypothetical protein